MKDKETRAGAPTPKAHIVRDTVIIPKIEKNYVDLLYLSCNLQDHWCHDDLPGYLRYDYQRHFFEVTYLFGVPSVGVAKGYEWYKLPNFRVGFMEYDKAKRSNQPNCVIQFEHDHIFGLGQDLDGLDLPFLSDRSKYMIKRIDVTKTARLDTDYTVNHGYISPFRDDPLNPTRFGNTVYLGSRENGNLFRMYPKTKELIDTQNFEKIARYSAEFGTIEDLYTFEHELRRNYLKESLGIDTLADLGRVWIASQSIVSQIRIFPITDWNIKQITNRHHKRVKAMTLTPIVEFDRPTKKKYPRSYKAMVRRMRGTLDAYLSTKEGQEWLGVGNSILLMYDLFDDLLEGKDLTVWIEDSTMKQELDKMREKHEAMRDGQTNELDQEAKRAFGKLSEPVTG